MIYEVRDGPDDLPIIGAIKAEVRRQDGNGPCASASPF